MNDTLDRLPAYKFPDPVAWQLRTGRRACVIAGFDDLAATAKALVEADFSTIGRRESNDLQSQLTNLCTCVEEAAQLDDDTVVFFNPEDGEFWAFSK